MAEIKGFKAMRFTQKAGEISELCCPPYDIISDQQRKEYLAVNEHNIIRLELPREGEDPYHQAAMTLNEWLDNGILACDQRDGIYIYEERFFIDGKEKSFKGFVCRVKIEEFEKGVVLPHEWTLSKAKADRFNLMKSTLCNFSQIYSLYKDDENSTAPLLEKLSKGAPDSSFTDKDNITHNLWIIDDDNAIATLSRQFADRKLYIADGHHRYETALNFRNYLREKGICKVGDECDYVMMMLVDLDHPGLVVFPTHRIVRGLENFDRSTLISGCEEFFDIAKCSSRQDAEKSLSQAYQNGKKAVALYDGTWSLFTLKSTDVLAKLLPDCSDALRQLDVTVLHTLILERTLGIDKENMANQINLTYTRDIDEAISAVDSKAANCSFIMNPTRVSEISAVATAGEKMPQKSTYFYPKLITGLVMNKFENIDDITDM